MGEGARDRSRPLLRTRPAPPDVLLTEQYVFFVASATDAAPVGREEAQAGQRDLPCYAFPSESTGIDSRVTKCRCISFTRLDFKTWKKAIKMDLRKPETLKGFHGRQNSRSECGLIPRAIFLTSTPHGTNELFLPTAGFRRKRANTTDAERGLRALRRVCHTDRWDLDSSWTRLRSRSAVSDSELCFPMWKRGQVGPGECSLCSNAASQHFPNDHCHYLEVRRHQERWSIHIFKALQYSTC